VFTIGDDGGNHLGVVTDLAGLDGAAMQSVATHLGFSETIFFDPDADEPFIRIFTPVAELAFAGHPLVGAAWALGADSVATGTMNCGVGAIAWRSFPDAAAVDVPFGTLVGGAVLAGGLIGALDAGEPIAAWEVDVPQRYLLCEVESASRVGAAVPDFRALAASRPDGILVFARGGEQVRARFFAPRLGVDEDPATGSAAAALATVLAGIESATGTLTIRQGPGRGGAEIGLAWSERSVTLRGSVREDPGRLLDV
jgi:trans-2,3-dihydro-3-hydroxyanthranilate isomerase